MPRKDGTGPMGVGSMTGKRLGLCTGADDLPRFNKRLDLGFGHRRGFGRGFGMNRVSSENQKKLLKERKNILKKQLEEVDKQLANL